MFTACGTENAGAGVTETLYEEITSEVTAENLRYETETSTESMSEESDDETSETEAVTAMSEETETETEQSIETEETTAETENDAVTIKSDDFTYTVPSAEFIESAVDDADMGSIYIAMLPDGSCQTVPYNHYWALMGYEELRGLVGDGKNSPDPEKFKEFRAMMAEPLFNPETEIYIDSDYNMKIGPAAYFIIHAHLDSNDEGFTKEENIAKVKSMADFLFEKPLEYPEIIDYMAQSLGEGHNYYCRVSYEVNDNGGLDLEASYANSDISFYDENNMSFNGWAEFDLKGVTE